jgi:hypothetical protein
MSLKARSLPSFYVSGSRRAWSEFFAGPTDLFGVVFQKPYFFVK